MRYGSVCSGIECATLAVHELGWEPVFFSEIEAFPRAVLAHHYPHVPCHGDFTTIEPGQYGAIDVLIGGTPCQADSIAGKREGLADERGALKIAYVELARKLSPRWLIWENVPGVLSTNGGRDFGTFLGALVECGYSLAYRILDAQYFGVPQRRRRVFLVGHLGTAWQYPAAVLFEPESLSWDNLSSRRTNKTPADASSGRAGARSGFEADSEAYGSQVAHTLRAEGFDASEDGTGRGIPLIAAALTTRPYSDREGQEANLVVANTLAAYSGRNHLDANYLPVAFRPTQDPEAFEDMSPPIDASHGGQPAIAFTCKDYGADAGEISPTLRAGEHHHSHQNGGVVPAVAYQCHGSNVGPMGTLRAGNGNETGGVPFLAAAAWAVRRLIPRECERLQAVRDDYTLVPVRTTKKGKVIMAADGPRYRALGNGFNVAVVKWLARRLDNVDRIIRSSEIAA